MKAGISYHVGPHVSIGGGVEAAPERAAALGATGFGMFTKNQVQWRAPAYAAASLDAFAARMQSRGFHAGQVLPHAGYLINLANPDPAAHARSVTALIDELQRCSQLRLDRLNLHPGSHLRLLSPEAALARVAAAINTALEQTTGVTVVIENTAGQGGCLGQTFDELAALLEQVHDRRRIGFCLDTAHMFEAGIDIRTADACARMLDQFDRTVGSASLRGMHLNDSRTGLGSRVDRHESLGKGQIGWEPFKVIMRDPRCAGLPLVLETPDEDLWPEEIKRLHDLQA